MRMSSIRRKIERWKDSLSKSFPVFLSLQDIHLLLPVRKLDKMCNNIPQRPRRETLRELKKDGKMKRHSLLVFPSLYSPLFQIQSESSNRLFGELSSGLCDLSS